ncbi:MAG: NfeD family protein [Opitutales bacterium]|nr:NfeD family protein [Opitutales bacterium]
MTVWQIWLAVALIFVVVELFTMTFACFGIAFGAATASVLAYYDFGLTVQLGGSAAGMTLFFLVLFPLSKKWRRNKSSSEASNMDALIDRTGVLIEGVEPGKMGRVAIDGDRWQVRAGTAIAAGKSVRVVAYDSTILEVVPVEK